MVPSCSWPDSSMSPGRPIYGWHLVCPSPMGSVLTLGISVRTELNCRHLVGVGELVWKNHTYLVPGGKKPHSVREVVSEKHTTPNMHICLTPLF